MKGRIVGYKKESLLVLKYGLWSIKHDPYNYILKKEGSHREYYYPSLESALQDLFSELVLDNIQQKDEYTGDIKELGKVINDTRQELKQAIQLNPTVVELQTLENRGKTLGNVLDV